MLVVGCVLTGAACDSGNHTAQSTQTAKQVREPVVFLTSVRSPDGKRIAVVRHFGKGSYLEVGPSGGGPRRTIYRSPGFITTDVYWASRYVIAFNDVNVDTIDIRTRLVRRILEFASSFTVSSDGRWIAWSKTDGPNFPDTVGVVPISGGECLLVPRPRNKQDTGAFFKPGVKRVFFLRGPFNSPRPRNGDSRIISVALSSLLRAPASAC